MTFLDQGLSSLTNFGGSALAAGLLSSSDFGAFAVSVSGLVLAVGVVRAWAGNLLMIIGSNQNEIEYRRSLSGAVGTSILIGSLASVVAIVCSALVDDQLRQALVALAACIPIVAAQDTYRMSSLTRRSPGAASVNDAYWLVAMVCCLMVLRRTDTASLFLAVLAANATAAAGLLSASKRHGVRISRRETLSWLRSGCPLAIRLTGEFLITIASGVVPLILVTAFNANLAQAGALRGAQALLGPLAVVFAASTLYCQPIMVRFHREQRSIRNLAARQSVLNTLLAIAWVLIAWSTPSEIGVRIFGSTWEGAQNIVELVGISFVGLAISSGPLTALRSRGQLNAGLATQAAVAICVIVAMGIGGLVMEDGLLRGFAVGNVIGSSFAWVALARLRVRDMVSERSTGPASTST